MSMISKPGLLPTLGHSSYTKQGVAWSEWVCPRGVTVQTIPHPGPFLRHQKKCILERMSLPSRNVYPASTSKWRILWNCSQLWTLKEWLLDEADHSPWPLLKVTVKKNDCPRPFPHTGHKGNHFLWYINNLSDHFHYENDYPIWTIFWTGKCMSVKNLKPLSELERNCSSLTIFWTEKWLSINQ